MFGSGVLDTAIGLVFVFLLVSILVTIANELISALLLSRAKWLRIGIERLIGSDFAKQLYAHPLIEGTAADAGMGRSGGWLASMRGSGPSYIPSRAFVNVLLHLVHDGDAVLKSSKDALQKALDAASAGGVDVDALKKRAVDAARAAIPAGKSTTLVADLERLLVARPSLGPDATYTVGDARADLQRFIDAMPARYLREVLERVPEQKVRSTLIALYDDAGRDIEHFKQNVEVWFNNSMDRVGGWYKRRSQWVVGLLGVIAAVGLNIDAIQIVNHLDTHAGVRDALVAEAKAYAESTSAPPAAAKTKATDDAAPLDALKLQSVKFTEVRTQLAQLNLPIGWVLASTAGTPEAVEKVRANRQLLRTDVLGDTILFHLLGWFITALAATLGAPFWFDTLNRIISIRSAGKAPEEKPRPPKEVPSPLEPGQSPMEADRLDAIRRLIR